MIDLLKIGELRLQNAVNCLAMEFVWRQGQCGDDRLGFNGSQLKG
jgi:hypothetical protein